MIRVVVDVPLPEWMDTDAAKLPSEVGLVMGETRKRPTVIGVLVCIVLFCEMACAMQYGFDRTRPAVFGGVPGKRGVTTKQIGMLVMSCVRGACRCQTR